MTWQEILKLSYSENMRRWDNQYYDSPSKTPKVRGKAYRMNQEQLQFYNKQKEELKQYSPNADKKAIHRMALKRTLRQYPNLQEA